MSNLADEKYFEETEVGPDNKPLYFNNVGLFSDTFLSDHLPELENKHQSAANRFLTNFWNSEHEPEFNKCYESMLQLWDEYEEILPTLSEAQLEERWVKPVFKLLGFEYEVQDRLKKRGKTQIPDYSLFASIDDYKKSKKAKTDESYFAHTLAVADAKAMNICLDGVGYSNNNPSYQIARYIEDTGNQWGILTDGRYWRLYSVRSQSKHTTFYEIDLQAILSRRNDERFKYFFNFFRKEAFLENPNSGQTFLDVVYENGVYYASQVEDDLKERIFNVVENMGRGFASTRDKLDVDDLAEVYNHSLYYLFRLMFVLNCESKGLLRVDKQADYLESSLRKLCIDLKKQCEEGKNWSSQGKSYNYVNELFELIKNGDEKIGVHGFGDEPFEKGASTFFNKYKIPDEFLNKALLELACAEDDDKVLQFIDYKRLSADHLGSIFEGLLEYTLEIADQDYGVEKNKFVAWSSLSAEKKKKLKDTKISKGELYLTNTNRERKNTGSYYTPDFLVDYMVNEPLSQVCSGLSVAEILDLDICDPSMGSAHFLLGVVRNLEEIILEKMEQGDSSTDLTAEAVRKEVLHSCVYGVDINPLAVELAKFSLWIYSAQKESELEPLSDQLKHGDSLVDSFHNYDKNFNWEESFKCFKEKRGFDVVVGNPPWDKLKGTDLDFFRYYSQDYAMQTKASKDKLKVKLLKDPEIKKAYDKYYEDKQKMIDHLKNSERYQSQVIAVNGRKVSGDSNLYKYFFEHFYNLTSESGVYSIVMPHSFISDTGASGLRKIILEDSTLKIAISFQNETNGIKAFKGVAPNVKVCGVVAEKGGKTSSYQSKYIKDFDELHDPNCFLKINQKKFGSVFGEYRNIICLEENSDISIHNKLNDFAIAKDEKDGIGLKAKDGEAHMTNKKKFFQTTKTKHPLVTGREFFAFSGIQSPSKYVSEKGFAEDVLEAKESRVVIKAIMPDSIKKVQSTVIPDKAIISNNLFTVFCDSNTELDKQVLAALLNSELMEYRVRCFLSNFRLTHRNLHQLPISKEIFNTLKMDKCKKVIQKAFSNPNSKSAVEELNQLIYDVYNITADEKKRIKEYIFGAEVVEIAKKKGKAKEEAA